jgi:hypothetical protein
MSHACGGFAHGRRAVASEQPGSGGDDPEGNEESEPEECDPRRNQSEGDTGTDSRYRQSEIGGEKKSGEGFGTGLGG